MASDVLSISYTKLRNIIIRNEQFLKNNSVLWTLMEISASKTEKYLASSSIDTDKIPAEQLRELQNSKFINLYESSANHIECIITAKGIWEVECKINNYDDDKLLDFIQEKHLSFKVKRKPLDDKDKLVILSLLCIRNFSSRVPMDLSTVKKREGWKKIFNLVFDYLNNNNLLKEKNLNFDKFIKVPGSEDPVQYILRRRNDLSIKSGQLFMNPGESKYWLNILEDDIIDSKKLQYLFKLIIGVIPDRFFIDSMKTFCIDLSNNMAKYVISDFTYINSEIDDMYNTALKKLYIDQ